MVEKIAKEVDHALDGELDVEEVRHLIGDAKAAADKLRAAGLTEEAALMDEMVVKLEGALQAHYDAHDLKHTAGPIDEGDLAAVLHQVLSSSRHLCKSLHSDGDDDIAQFVDVFKFGV